MSKQKGFTVIELMIATSVFSVVLLMAASGLLNIGRLYYKGLTSSATQEAARNVMQELTQDFELSGGFFRQLPPNGVNEGFCIGSHLYSYISNSNNWAVDNKINNDGTGHSLVVRDEAACDVIVAQLPDPILGPANPNWRELLGPNMRIQSLIITPEPVGDPRPQSAKISIKILSGDKDLFDNDLVPPTTALCKSVRGSQFCAASELTTYVVRRIKVN